MNSRPRPASDHHTVIGSGWLGAASRNDTSSVGGTDAGRSTDLVYTVRKTVFRSPLVTRTMSGAAEESGNSKMYVPEWSVTPGSSTDRLNVRYCVRLASSA